MSNPIQQAIEALKLANETSYSEANCEKFNAALSALQSLQGVELPEPVAHMNLHGVIHEAGYQWLPVEKLQGLYTADQLRTAVAAALGRGAVPSGWKLVPVEPTPEMRKAAADAWLDCDSKLFLNKAGAAVRAAIAISKESA